MHAMLQRVANHHDRVLDGHEARIAALERRRPGSTGRKGFSYTDCSRQRRISPHLRKWRNGRRASLRS